MNKAQRHYHNLLLEALDNPLGLKVKTNDAQKLQRELGIFRVYARNKGETGFDGLSFRQHRPVDEVDEYVYITKKLSPDEIRDVNKILLKDKENGPEKS